MAKVPKTDAVVDGVLGNAAYDVLKIVIVGGIALLVRPVLKMWPMFLVDAVNSVEIRSQPFFWATCCFCGWLLVAAIVAVMRMAIPIATIFAQRDCNSVVARNAPEEEVSEAFAWKSNLTHGAFIAKCLTWVLVVCLFLIMWAFSLRMYQSRFATQLDRNVLRTISVSDKEETRHLLELQDAVTDTKTLTLFLEYLKELDTKHNLNDEGFSWGDLGIGH